MHLRQEGNSEPEPEELEGGSIVGGFDYDPADEENDWFLTKRRRSSAYYYEG